MENLADTFIEELRKFGCKNPFDRREFANSLSALINPIEIKEISSLQIDPSFKLISFDKKEVKST